MVCPASTNSDAISEPDMKKVTFPLVTALLLVNFTQAAQGYDLPPGSLVIEAQPLRSAAHSDRGLLLWMVNPKRNPRKASEVYTCPEYTRGSYYSGATRVSLVNTKTRRVINTLNVVRESDSGNDSFDIPYLIDKRFYYRVPVLKNRSEGKPVVMWLKDYNGDGRAQEFALFDAEACMPLATTLIGYSEALDRVIQYSAEVEVVSGAERRTETMHWVSYLFSGKPARRGYWKYQIDYRGRGGPLASYEVRYNARRERFEGRFVYESGPTE
jgi:hypothetical protein